MSVNISEAALFRSIASEKPTVIIDEAEALRNKDSDRAQCLLPILNAGFMQGNYVRRCVGRNHDVEKFPVYSPKAILANWEPPRHFDGPVRSHFDAEAFEK